MMKKTVFTGAGLSILLASLALAGPLAAQQRSLQLYVHGGGYSPTQDVDPGGLADFDTGFNLGGGVGVVLSRYLGVRGDFTYGRNQARDARPNGSGLIGSLNGQDFNRFFYGGDVQLRLPVGEHLVPYIFGGGGAVTIDPAFSTGGAEDSFTNGAGKFGGGVEWKFAGTGFGLLVQGTAWVYDLDEATFGFEETQFDFTYSVGVSYAFGL